MNYEFANWYPKYSTLVPKARVLRAPEEFRQYLLADGIALRDEEVEESSELVLPPIGFHTEIEAAIKELNGEVAPKLNWSAPVDAVWMSTSNTMRCTSANDVYMLLKSSDYINHDLQREPKEVTLVLREWFDLHPSTEFRCFLREGKLVGITQRDMNFYDFLEAEKPQITDLCQKMALKLVDFADKTFVFDVHIKDNRAWLVDINPWGPPTDTLLFSWDELESKDQLELRLVSKVDRTRTFSSKPHSTSHVPYELVEMDRTSFEDVLKQMKAQRQDENN